MLSLRDHRIGNKPDREITACARASSGSTEDPSKTARGTPRAKGRGMNPKPLLAGLALIASCLAACSSSSSTPASDDAGQNENDAATVVDGATSTDAATASDSASATDSATTTKDSGTTTDAATADGSTTTTDSGAQDATTD